MAEIPVNLLATADVRPAFIKAAIWHGTLDYAEAILAAHPELAAADIHVGAILGDEEAVHKFLSIDAANATAISEPYGGDALVYLSLSKYLRLDKSRSESFLRATKALLDAGANPNTGFWTTGQYKEFETAMYGAAGVTQHAGLTKLLLDYGADPNDDETPYHSPETYENDTLKVLLESGKLTENSLATMLPRKADWHDHDGIKMLLEHGADPNKITVWGFTALHQAIRRDNALSNILLMLDHGADPAITTVNQQFYPGQQGKSAVAIAARRGRADVLNLFKARGLQIYAGGTDGLIAACAMNDAAVIESIVSHEPRLVDEIIAEGGTLLAEFAGTGNTGGVRLLLKLGVDIGALYDGDGYFDIAANSTALHVAAWKGWHGTVQFLIEQGAQVNVLDGKGRTPLALAVKACIDSYWKSRRKPDSVAALLNAGATTQGINWPTGYVEIDELLKKYFI